MENYNTIATPISQWAEDDKPREKLLNKGRQVLSDAELLGILISSGVQGESAVDIGRKILAHVKNNLNELGRLSIDELTQFKGIGEARAITIAAALELGRRRQTQTPEVKPFLKSSKDIANIMQPLLADLSYEVFYIMLANKQNELIKKLELSRGSDAGTVVDKKKIMQLAISNNASSIVLCHNHPSGSLVPSQQDIAITKVLVEAAKLLDLTILDHVIVSKQGFYSFVDNNMM